MPKLLLLTLLILIMTACNPGSINNALDRLLRRQRMRLRQPIFRDHRQQFKNKVAGYVSVVMLPAAKSRPMFRSILQA